MMPYRGAYITHASIILAVLVSYEFLDELSAYFFLAAVFFFLVVVFFFLGAAFCWMGQK